MQSKKKFFFIGLVLIVALFSGCQSSKSLENNLSSLRVALGADGGASTKESANVLRARKIKKRLLAIDGISGCHVVITGRTALIAIEVGSSDLTEVDRLKKEASRQARLEDEAIRSTAITANAEIGSMIGEMEEEKEAQNGG